MLVRVERRDHYLRAHFEGGDHADFHWFWLRLACSNERHPTTGEPTLSPSRAVARPEEVWLVDGVLAIRWKDEPQTRPPSYYPGTWLRERAYALNRQAPVAPPREVAAYELTLEDGRFPDAWRERLARDGAVVLRGDEATATPEATERWIEDLEREGLSVVETHFGRVEDLRTDNTTNANTDQLGYTDAGIDLHTDQPFLDEPPRYQLLHCVRAADSGGESSFADGLAAAEWLRANDAEAYTTLTTLPVVFDRKQRGFARKVVGPILETRVGRFVRIRHSYFTMAPLDLPFECVEAFYRAYRELDRVLARFRVDTTLRPGDALLYDNHRMLHGRTAFRGPRWVRGVYFDERPSSDSGTTRA